MTLHVKSLIWLDLEMTGLDPSCDKILEIATIVTTPNLEIIAEGPVFAISQPLSLLHSMDSWNFTHHTQSGLLARVKESQVTEATAEAETLIFLKKHLVEKSSPLCGNSICLDRRFLFRYMPKLERFFHYRHLDVSSLKILFQLWKPNIAAFHKSAQHLALADIRESIEELKYYRNYLFNDS